MATHVKRFSDSPCSNNCTEMSEGIKISFQCLCCKINNDKNLKNLVDFDTVEELCAHLAVTHLQAFLDFHSFDFRNYRFTMVYNSILFSSLLVLLSNLNLRSFCFRVCFCVSPH